MGSYAKRQSYFCLDDEKPWTNKHSHILWNVLYTTQFSCAAELFLWVWIPHHYIMVLFPVVLWPLKPCQNNRVRLKFSGENWFKDLTALVFIWKTFSSVFKLFQISFILETQDKHSKHPIWHFWVEHFEFSPKQHG